MFVLLSTLLLRAFPRVEFELVFEFVSQSKTAQQWRSVSLALEVDLRQREGSPVLTLLHSDGPSSHLTTQQEGTFQAVFFPEGFHTLLPGVRSLASLSALSERSLQSLSF